MLYDISSCIILFLIKEGVFAMAYSGGPMTEAMYYVLLALKRPNHGYQLMQAIAEVSNGRVNMGPGTLYGVLTRMQKEGLISLAEDDGRRKTYQITLEGEQALRVEYERLKALIIDSGILEEG
jgi:DNA-binding PadR family transcriptional regulator